MSEDRFDRETGEIISAPRAVAHQEMRPMSSPEVIEVMTAISKAQGVIVAPKRTKPGIHDSKYAPLEDIIAAIQQPFVDNGLARQQYIVSRGEFWFVRTIVWHVSGQWISGDYPVFAEQMTAHKFAGGVTYASRKGLCLLLGIVPEGEDNDVTDQPDGRPARGSGIDQTGRAIRMTQGVTRASPAVAVYSPDQESQRAAAKNIKRAIDASQDADALLKVYDVIKEEWGKDYEAEAALLSGVTLDFLRSHVQSQLQKIGAA